MRPQPHSGVPGYIGCGKPNDEVAVVTGGDSGIGRAVAVLFAKEGADVAIVYLEEHKDPRETERFVEEQGIDLGLSLLADARRPFVTRSIYE